MFPVYGIVGTETTDRVGESLSIQGADISNLKVLNDEHGHNAFDTLGEVKEVKKIWRPEDCTDSFQQKCWEFVKKPFIYMFGYLVGDNHPNAAAAKELIRYSSNNPEFPIGLSVQGSTLERDGQRLVKTKIVAASLTVKPCNPECRIFAVDNLAKSNAELPEQYRNVEGRKSFRNLPDANQRLLHKSMFIKELNTLLKSDPSMTGATVMKCWGCGEAELFMKSRLPNKCRCCGESFSMKDIYEARNSKSIV